MPVDHIIQGRAQAFYICAKEQKNNRYNDDTINEYMNYKPIHSM